jgi:hypothetical protein
MCQAKHRRGEGQPAFTVYTFQLHIATFSHRQKRNLTFRFTCRELVPLRFRHDGNSASPPGLSNFALSVPPLVFSISLEVTNDRKGMASTKSR